MLIKFTSNIKNKNNKNKVEFTSPVVIGAWNEFVTYEFHEPAINEKNRIEVSENSVNIITGVNTLNLSLNQKIPIQYVVQGGGTLLFETQLHYLKKEKSIINFKYSLLDNENIIGEYEITLTLIKEN